jgi:hypothetical protein
MALPSPFVYPYERLANLLNPIFFPIHAFIDKIFELYRQKLMSRGIDPEETYPVKNIAFHGPEHKTIWVPIYPDVEFKYFINECVYREENGIKSGGV